MAIKDIYDLSGGINQQVSPLIVKDNQCEIIQNFHLDNVGSLTKRNGIVRLIGQVVDNKSILGMYVFDDKVGTDYSNIFAVIDDSSSTNSDIFAVASNAWAISKADDTAGAIPYFCTFIDYIFRTNGSNAMGSSTNPTPTTGSWGTTNCLATLLPKYCCVWEDRVYAGNDNSATSYPSRIYWSSLPSGTPLALTWDSANDYADINPDDNDEITWLHPYGKVLLIFKENAFYHWTFGQTEPDKNPASEGTPQGLTVKESQGIVFFANQNGVFAITAPYTPPKLISRKVQSFIDAIPTLANMRVEVDRDHYYLYIGDVTVNSVSYANTMLVYTISLDAWHIETYPFEVKAMARLKRKTLGTTEIYNDIYIGDDDGNVYRKASGTVDYSGATAIPINGYIKTKEYPLNFPKHSELEQLYFTASKASGIKVNYYLDGGQDPKSWHDIVKRFTDARIVGKAKTIQLSITDNSRIQSQIEGFSIEHTPEKEKRRESETKRQR